MRGFGVGRILVIATGALAVVLGALAGVGSTAAVEAAQEVEATFAFTASSVGAGPNCRGSAPGAPARSLRGTFTVAYVSGRPATARVKASGLRLPIGLGRPEAARSLGGLVASLEEGRSAVPLLRLDGAACGALVCGGADDISIAFDADMLRQPLGAKAAAAVSYALAGGREVFRARTATVTLIARS